MNSHSRKIPTNKGTTRQPNPAIPANNGPKYKSAVAPFSNRKRACMPNP
jgi:hypothetical protein